MIFQWKSLLSCLIHPNVLSLWCARCYTGHVTSFLLYNDCLKWALLTTSYWWRSWGSERLRFAWGHIAESGAEREFANFFPLWLPFTISTNYFINKPLCKCTLTYSFLHQSPLVFGAHMEPWGVQSYGQLPEQTGAASEWRPWPSSQSCPGAGGAMSESVPSLNDSCLQALSEPFSCRVSEICLGWLRPLCARGTESDGFRFQFHHLPVVWGQERSELLCASVSSSVNPFIGFLWEINEVGHENT